MSIFRDFNFTCNHLSLAFSCGSGISIQAAFTESCWRLIVYYAFDLLYLDGRDLTSHPLIECKTALKTILAKGISSKLRFTDHIVGEGEPLFGRA